MRIIESAMINETRFARMAGLYSQENDAEKRGNRRELKSLAIDSAWRRQHHKLACATANHSVATARSDWNSSGTDASLARRGCG